MDKILSELLPMNNHVGFVSVSDHVGKVDIDYVNFVAVDHISKAAIGRISKANVFDNTRYYIIFYSLK